MSPDIAAGIAVLDLKYLASAFCYVLDRRTNRLHEFARLAPFGLGLRFTGDPQRGAVRFRSRGIRIDLDHDVAAGERRLKLTSRTYRGAIDGMTYPRPIAAGRSADGQRVIGFNLTRGSDGLGEPENFLWFDGEPVAVGRVSFAMDLARKDGEWAVRSEDGRVRLTLRPDVVRQGQRDAIWAKVYFRQPIGRFSGTLVDPHGKTVEVRDLAGFASDQTAHW